MIKTTETEEGSSVIRAWISFGLPIQFRNKRSKGDRWINITSADLIGVVKKYIDKYTNPYPHFEFRLKPNESQKP